MEGGAAAATAAGGADFDDWEIIFAIDTAGDDHSNPPYAAAKVEAHDFEEGSYRFDNFTFSEEGSRKGAFGVGGVTEEEVRDDPSSIIPELSSNIAGIDSPVKEKGGCSSAESPEGQRLLAGSESGELGETGGSEVEMLDGALEENLKEAGGLGWSIDKSSFPEIDFQAKENVGFRSSELSDGQKSLAGSKRNELGEAGALEENIEQVGVGELGTIERIEAKEGDLNEPYSGESLESWEKSDSEVEKGVSAWNGEKEGMVWWKMPLELLKFCAFRVKPVWSISIAAAVLGVLMLAKRLHRMKHRKRNIPLKITLDEKKASQLKVQVARLNEAFSIVKSSPVVRAQLPAGGPVSWPMLSLP